MTPHAVPVEYERPVQCMHCPGGESMAVLIAHRAPRTAPSACHSGLIVCITTCLWLSPAFSLAVSVMPLAIEVGWLRGEGDGLSAAAAGNGTVGGSVVALAAAAGAPPPPTWLSASRAWLGALASPLKWLQLYLLLDALFFLVLYCGRRVWLARVRTPPPKNPAGLGVTQRRELLDRSMLATEDRRAMLEGWFRGAHTSSIWRGNAEEWVAWCLWGSGIEALRWVRGGGGGALSRRAPSELLIRSLLGGGHVPPPARYAHPPPRSLPAASTPAG
jgi:hypothetical protein